ncbi:orotate phosphoribosyltransferase [Candidatus Woesearchaeota archaeon]|nr:orotate phosphoribosyltransferase [Candidatus Woesearchaeota archaeon]
MDKDVAKILLEIKAVTLSPNKGYRYASGILSPIYCDNRLLMSYPDKRKQVVDYFIKKIKQNNLEFDVIAGTATAGIPHAAWISDKLNKPMIYIRSASKEHGKENRIEGKLENGQKVLVIEDLVSTGGSSVSAVEAVKQAGGVVEECIAIFSYEMEKATQRFEQAECKLLTLTNFSTLVDVASKEDYITNQDKEIILQWNKDPQGWGKKVGLE